jgi:large subunit ribosomal protein L5
MKLQELYKKEITKQLKEKLGIKNVMAIPNLSKVVINVGFGRQSKDKDLIELVQKSLTAISGQKPVLTKSKKAISAFKIRENLVIGSMVTLRGKRMWDFVDKLVNVYFPRVRDFRGISDKQIDMQGNLTVGFKDILAFPEIEVQDLDKVHGLEISLSTTAKDAESGLEFFRALGFPFAPNDNK